MKKRILFVSLLSACCAMPAGAQTEIVSNGTNAGFRVQGSGGDDINSAPWYGMGESTANLWQGGPGTSVQVAGYFGLNFQTGNGEMVMRGDNGYVGIGTASPSQPLTVNGNMASILDGGAVPGLNLAGIISLGFSGATGAENWALRGVYQYGNEV